MRKLMRANLARLWKSRIFWLCVIGLAVMSVCESVDNLKLQAYDEVVYTEDSLFEFTPMLGVVLAAFCSLFIGTEYSDGAMRNKLIVGCRRGSIFLANFLTCAISGTIISLGYIVPCVALGGLMLDGFNIGAGTIAALLGQMLMMIFASAALCNCAAMLIHSRSACTVALLVGAFLLMMMSLMIDSRLDQPKTHEIYEMVNEYGMPMEAKTVENPYYLDGRKRQVYQFLSDFLPSGQAVQLVGGSVETSQNWKMPVYSLVVVLGSCAAGMWCFKRKDIK